MSEWSENFQRSAEADMSPRYQELRRAAAVTRSVIANLVGTEASADVLEAARRHLEAALVELEGFSKRRNYEGFAEAATSGNPAANFENSPVMGRSNPLAPPIQLRAEGSKVHGTAVFGSAYEGPPGHVHGGYVAAAFDEMLGMVQAASGTPGMTGRLVVNYRSPTPLHTELQFEAWVERVDGRKIFCAGTIHAGDVLCAEAEGLFISIDFAKFSSLMEARGIER